MLFKIVLAVAALMAIFFAYVAMKPSYFEVSRSITIAAAPAVVFPFVNTRTVANSWNPWLTQDTGIKMTVSGPEVGVGSKTSWEGGAKTGTGSATVTESIPNERLVVKLEYLKPFPMTQDASFTLKPVGNGTEVTWKVYGHNTFPSRLMCTFMDMDEMVGSEFVKGLTMLKTLVEKPKA